MGFFFAMYDSDCRWVRMQLSLGTMVTFAWYDDNNRSGLCYSIENEGYFEFIVLENQMIL